MPVTNVIQAYGHGIGPSLIARPLGIVSEMFSTNRVTTGDFILITGEVENHLDSPISLSPHIFASRVQSFPEGTVTTRRPPQDELLDIVYPPARDQSTMLFRVTHNLSNPVIVEPGKTVSYEIKVYPLKAGTFHIHALFLSDYSKYIGRGQTVFISGENTTTSQEFTQL